MKISAKDHVLRRKKDHVLIFVVVVAPFLSFCYLAHTGLHMPPHPTPQASALAPQVL